MANKKISKPTPPSNPSFRGFLNLTLTPDDKFTIKGTVYDESLFFADLDRWIDDGYKFTFSRDDYNHAYQVIGTRQDKEHPDYGILLAGRGSTPIKSFKQWIYIVTALIGDSSWSDCLDQKPSTEIDD
jgi:hypothetical protein